MNLMVKILWNHGVILDYFASDYTKSVTGTIYKSKIDSAIKYTSFAVAHETMNELLHCVEEFKYRSDCRFQVQSWNVSPPMF